MEQEPIPISPEALVRVTARLARLLTWSVIITTHLALWLALLTLAWALQIAPADVWSAYQQIRQGWPGKAAALLGLTAVSVATAWLWLMRKLLATVGKHLVVTYLMKGARR